MTTSTPPLQTAAGRGLNKRAVVAAALFLGVLTVFLTQTRLPNVLRKLPTLGNAASARGRTSFGQLVDPQSLPDGFAWVASGLNLWDANAVGMFFAVLLGSAAITALQAPSATSPLLRRKGAAGAGLGGGLGLPLFMCSACSAPVSLGFYRGGAALETSLGMIFGSALFNPVGLFAIATLMPTQLVAARVTFGLAAIFVLVPLVSRSAPPAPLAPPLPAVAPDNEGWAEAALAVGRDWWRHTTDVAVRIVPAMFLAGFAVGVVFQLAPPQGLSDAVAPGVLAVVVAAAVGTLVQLPTLFEIPLVLGVLALGLGAGPAAALLVTAPSAGVVTFGITRRELGWRVPASLLVGTFVGGTALGLLVELL